MHPIPQLSFYSGSRPLPFNIGEEFVFIPLSQYSASLPVAYLQRTIISLQRHIFNSINANDFYPTKKNCHDAFRIIFITFSGFSVLTAIIIFTHAAVQPFSVVYFDSYRSPCYR
ncbi:hypothetical protein CDAR_121991 [Caerostris darwini]|uniref:Uncharacterized protein n=1 Tax=Caerostris darwini TaxID=1538125 RepID=A0AAV4PQ36_9ARAC|nr:hypothetical protein CDAR_121991 [Caerostris darwini]